jgi:hypothetical protein
MCVDDPHATIITKLYRGWHDPGDKMCLLEAVARVAGEPWSDEPECCCLVFIMFGRVLNDWLDDEERQQLLPYVERLKGTRGDAALEQLRAYMCADWAVRTIAPIALCAVGPHAVWLREYVDRLEALPSIISQVTAKAAHAAAQAAWAAADDAWATLAAAQDPETAKAAAKAAKSVKDAIKAAGAAVWAAKAADASAGASAVASARAAAEATPSARTEIIAAAFNLLDRMIEVGRHA